MKKTKNSLPILACLMVLSSSVVAQEYYDTSDDLLDSSVSSFDMDEIQIEGKLSPSEQMRRRREKLEERNKNMVEKKIEDIRVKQEIILTNKLQDAFNKGLNNLNEDNVSVKEAAPVLPQPIVQPVIETKVEPVKVERNSQVIPFVGGQAIKGSFNGIKIDFETKMLVGVQVETKVDEQLMAGAELSYATLTTTDRDNAFVTAGSLCSNGQLCGAREIAYGKWTLGGNLKYLFTQESRFKPYIAAGANYNRVKLDFNDSGAINGVPTTNINGFVLGDESVNSNYVSGNVKLGVQLDVNEKWGANLEVSYTKNFVSKKNYNTSYNSDQIRLENISNAMEQSDITAIGAGLVVKF